MCAFSLGHGHQSWRGQFNSVHVDVPLVGGLERGNTRQFSSCADPEMKRRVLNQWNKGSPGPGTGGAGRLCRFLGQRPWERVGPWNSQVGGRKWGFLHPLTQGLSPRVTEGWSSGWRCTRFRNQVLGDPEVPWGISGALGEKDAFEPLSKVYLYCFGSFVKDG